VSIEFPWQDQAASSSADREVWIEFPRQDQTVSITEEREVSIEFPRKDQTASSSVLPIGARQDQPASSGAEREVLIPTDAEKLDVRLVKIKPEHGLVVLSEPDSRGIGAEHKEDARVPVHQGAMHFVIIPTWDRLAVMIMLDGSRIRMERVTEGRIGT